MEIYRLAELLSTLNKARVRSFEGEGIKLELFGSSEIIDVQPEKPSTVSNPLTTPVAPPDLKADDLMSFDKILNWSAPGSDEGEGESMPMTGDVPIEGIK